MRILVTGGAGFIGRYLVDLLVARGRSVTILDNLDPQVHGQNAPLPDSIRAHVTTEAVRFVHGNVADRSAVDDALQGITHIVHLAAAVGVGQSMYRPQYYVHANSMGTGVLLEAVVGMRRDLAKLVVASSMSIYGEGAHACPACGCTDPAPREPERLAGGAFEVPCARCGRDMEARPTDEGKPPVIASVYAATKKHQEDLFVAFGGAYRIPTFALRFFNVYGPGQSLSNPYTGVAAIFLSRLLNREPPLIFEDGQQSRDFIHVRDIAQALLLAVESAETGVNVLNVGTGARSSVMRIAEVLARSLGLDVAPKLLGTFRAGDVRHCFASPVRARQLLGFEARIGLDEGLAELARASADQHPDDRVEASLQELKEKGLVG